MKHRLTEAALAFLIILMSIVALSQEAQAGVGGDAPCNFMGITELAHASPAGNVVYLDPAVSVVWASTHVAVWRGQVPPLAAVIVAVQYDNFHVARLQFDPRRQWMYTARSSRSMSAATPPSAPSADQWDSS